MLSQKHSDQNKQSFLPTLQPKPDRPRRPDRREWPDPLPADITLADLEGRLLFYPSCGPAVHPLFRLDYDIFVLADYLPGYYPSQDAFFGRLSCYLRGVELIRATENSRVFRWRHKIGFLFFEDNNRVLDIIKKSGHQIDCFVGIRDGCEEGGNYECVNRFPFFGKVLEMVPASGMTYYTDHSTIIARSEGGGWTLYLEVIEDNKRLLHAGQPARPLSMGPIHPVEQYTITHHQPTIREWRGEQIRVTLEHDNIVNHLADLDGVFTSSWVRMTRQRETEARTSAWFARATRHFFKPSAKAGWTTADSVKLLLRVCERRQWSVVGTTAFGEGQHADLLKILQCRQGNYPVWIRIFHFDANDFADIRDQFQLVI